MTLSLAALASGIGAILAHYRPNGRRAFLLLKPLTTLLILGTAVQSWPEVRTSRVWLIAAGLVFALAGDVLLMFPERHFIRGMLSFTVTHLLYLLAFSSTTGIVLLRPLSLPFVAFAGMVVRAVWEGVGPRLRAPILVYVAVITAMAAQAGGAAIQQPSLSASLAAVGAILFFASDTVLAVNRFRRPFAAAQAVVLSTYWMGQWLIAQSSAYRP